MIEKIAQTKPSHTLLKRFCGWAWFIPLPLLFGSLHLFSVVTEEVILKLSPFHGKSSSNICWHQVKWRKSLFDRNLIMCVLFCMMERLSMAADQDSILICSVYQMLKNSSKDYEKSKNQWAFPKVRNGTFNLLAVTYIHIFPTRFVLNTGVSIRYKRSSELYVKLFAGAIACVVLYFISKRMPSAISMGKNNVVSSSVVILLMISITFPIQIMTNEICLFESFFVLIFFCSVRNGQSKSDNHQSIQRWKRCLLQGCGWYAGSETRSYRIHWLFEATTKISSTWSKSENNFQPYLFFDGD